MKLLAFDYGASSGRGMIGEYDGTGLSLREIHRFKNEPVRYGAHLHWDFPRLFAEMKQGMAAAARDAGGDVASMAVNTWGVDFGLIDRHGLLMANPFHYRDTLTEGAMESVFEHIPRRELYHLTGLQYLRFNTLYQLYAISRRYPELLERAGSLLLMPSLFNYFLCGAVTSEFSMASTTQLMDVRSRVWDPGLLGIAGVGADIMPQIEQPGAVLGELTSGISAETGLKTRVISVCGHDTASAVMAVPMRKGDHSAYLSCGTWSLLGVELDLPVTHDSAYQAEYTNEGGYGGTVRFLKNIMGQWISQELKRDYEREHGETGFDVLDRLEAEAPEFACFINPDHEDFLTAGHMADKIRNFCVRTGQEPPGSIGAALRCVTESLALAYRHAVEKLETVLGYKIPMLHVVGGGCRNLQLIRSAASALGRPVCAGPVEASAIGNICCQLMALGELSDLQQARSLIADSFSVQTYAPSDTGKWEDAYGRYLEILNKSQGGLPDA